MKTLSKNIVGNRRRTVVLEKEVLFANVKIYNRKSTSFIHVENGIIKKIVDKKPHNFSGKIYDLSGKIIIPGAIDLHMVIREPGREDVETLETAALAAGNGGFTQICMMPSTNPPIDSVEMVQFIKEKASKFLTKINIIASLSKKREGKSIAPFAELVEEGVIAFSDGRKHISSSRLMCTALIYMKMLNRPIIVKPAESELNENGQINEGFQSTRLGFIGMPRIAEEIVISRDIQIVEYTNSCIHFTNISTRGSVELIRKAKKKNLNISCDVAIHNLLNHDEIMEQFDVNFKLDPPLREKDDIKALIEALNDGTIDAISSAHLPHSWEEKEAEFIYAPFGAVSIETMIPLILDRFFHSGIFTLEQIVNFISINPAQIFKLEQNEIIEGKMASFCILDLGEVHQIDKKLFLSKAQNTPYDGIRLKGNVIGVISNGQKYFK